MTEHELGDWKRYAATKMLPWRRVELLLAQVAMHVALSGGAKNVKLSDFLFDPPDIARDDDAANDDEITPEDVAAQFGARVYRKVKG